MFDAKRAFLVLSLEALVFLALLMGKDFAGLSCSGFSLSSASSTLQATATAASEKQQRRQQQQRNLVAQQLGYVPSNFVRIAAFCRDGSPLVLQTYPLAGGSPRRQARSSSSNSKNSNNNIQTPFPTLYWLCHPQVNKCVAELERRGCVAEFQCRLDDHPQLRGAWVEAHRQYAVERWESLTAEDQRRFDLQDNASSDAVRGNDGASKILESKRHVLRESGIAGSNITTDGAADSIPSIKCLHAHYAHYRGSTTIKLTTTKSTGTTISDLLRTTNPVGAMVHERLQAEFPELIL